MKAVFLTLLAVNLLYLGWRLWIVPSEAPPVLVEADNVPRLVLVGEDPGAMRMALGPAAAAAGDDDVARGAAGPDEPAPEPGPVGEAPEAQATEAADNGTGVEARAPAEVAVGLVEKRCVSLGPFLNLREATEATARLNEVGLSPSQRLAESQVWFGHWVHLPSLPSRAAAVEIVEGLRAQGVTDIYIEPSGPFANSISLGVFSDSAHAETRAGQIRKMGVSPQIRDRYRDSSVYWVDFELGADQVIDPAEYQASPSRVLRLEGRECPEPA